MCGGGLRARAPASSRRAGYSWDWTGRASEGRQRPRHKLPGTPSTTTLRGRRDRPSKREEWGLRDAEDGGSPGIRWEGRMRRRRPRPAARRDRGLWVPGGTAAVPARPARQRDKPRGACNSVALPSRGVAFTGRRAGGSRVPSPGARRNQPQRTPKPAAAEPKKTGSKGRGRNRRADRKCVVEAGNVL